VEVPESVGLGENDVSIPVGKFRMWSWVLIHAPQRMCQWHLYSSEVKMVTVVEGEYVIKQEVQG